MRMNFAWGIRLTIFSAMPSSGGLMKSSAELIQRTGTVMVPRLGAGVVVAGGVDVVDEVVGIGVGDAAGEGAVGIGFGGGAGGRVLLHLERAGAHDQEQLVGGAEADDGFGGVLAVLPGGIVLDVFDGHVAHHAVASGDLDGKAGHGHEGVGEAGVGFAPDEGLHAAHGGAEDEAEVIDVEAFEEHGVLAGDHVVVVVVGEAHAEAVAGLAGLAVADVVGEDEVRTS